MLEILKFPDDRLKQISKPVERFDSKLHKLLDDMAVTMYGAKGVGLAAPQVAELVRLFVIDIGEEASQECGIPRRLYEFINPKISQKSGKIVFEEGCLSVPGVTEEVTRSEHIVVNFQDRQGKDQEMEATGLLAVAIQHENDHLDGILFIEKLSPLKRRLVKRQLSKAVTL